MKTWKFHLITVCIILICKPLLAASVIVSWDPNQESDLSGYRIYYGKASRQYDQMIDVGNVTSFKIDNLQVGVTYYFAVTAYDFSGNESDFSEEVSATIEDTGDDDEPDDSGNQSTVDLAYNFPNPFRADREVTRIRYELSEPAEVTIEIFDLNNNLIRTLQKQVFKNAGEHTEDIWDGRNDQGEPVANGVYFCRIKTENSQKIIKIAVTR